MNTGFLLAAVAIVLLAIPYLGRAMVGPSLFDRLVALNGIGTKLPILVVLIGVLYQRAEMFVDIALGILLLNLFATLLIARYVRRRKSVPAK